MSEKGSLRKIFNHKTNGFRTEHYAQNNGSSDPKEHKSNFFVLSDFI